MKFTKYTLAMVLALSATAAAGASENPYDDSNENTSPAKQQTNSVERWDRNNDGVASRDEITDPENFLSKKFDQIDSNDDNTISSEEVNSFYNSSFMSSSN
jgi:hypothetical protein